MKNNKLFIVICIVSILILLFGGILFITFKVADNEKSKVPDAIVEKDDNKKNELKFSLDFGGQLYDLYLIDKKEVKVVTTSEIYEVCPDTNCMKHSGEKRIEEQVLELSDRELVEVVKVYESLFIDGKTELNISDVELNDEQERVIYSLVLNSGETLTIQDDLKFKTVTKELKYDKVILNNKVMYVEESSNETVNNIGKFINKIVDDNYKQIEEEFNLFKKDFDLMSDEDLQDFNLTLKVEYIGPSNISLSFTLEGGYYGHNYYLVKGYTFNVFNGDVKEIPRRYQSRLHDAAIKEIENNKDYKDLIVEFTNDWKDILKEEMYKEGNWYLTDGKICFLIVPDYLGVNYLQLMSIEVPFREREL